MKNIILDHIYAIFADWCLAEKFCCAPGCASCCTQNVTITALEGRRILEYCKETKEDMWTARRFNTLRPGDPPTQTTNEYVHTILQNRESRQELKSQAKCPFLDNDRCAIYPMRPFSCRCFFSTEQCRNNEAATLSEAHLYGSMAVMQLIEHLGQFDHWGNMIDVLTVLMEVPEHLGRSDSFHNRELVRHARAHVRPAQPLPGFILPEAEKKRVDPLLRSILTTRLGLKTIEQILNGR